MPRRSRSYDPDGEIVSRVWDFGDYEATTTQGDVLTSVGRGSDGGILTVIDNEGATASVEFTPWPPAGPLLEDDRVRDLRLGVERSSSGPVRDQGTRSRCDRCWISGRC